MNPVDRIQFKYRLTGDDFKPRIRTWLLPVLGALLVFTVMYFSWK